MYSFLMATYIYFIFNCNMSYIPCWHITKLSFSRDGMNCFKVKNESDVSVCGHTKIKRWAKRKQFHGWAWDQSASSRGGQFPQWRWERRLRQ